MWHKTAIVALVLTGCGSDAALEENLAAQQRRIDALEARIQRLESAPPRASAPRPRDGMTEDQRHRVNEVAVEVIEEMQEDGTLKRAGQIGLDALEQLVEQKRRPEPGP